MVNKHTMNTALKKEDKVLRCRRTRTGGAATLTRARRPTQAL